MLRLQTASAAFERQLNTNIIRDTRGRLNQIKAPTLILAGKNDELTPPNMTEELITEIPGSKLVIFELGGHALYWKVPELFNESVINFIKQHEDDLH